MMLIKFYALVIGFVVLFFTWVNVAAQTTTKDAFRMKFETRVHDIVKDFDGVIGLSLKDLTTGESLSVNGDVVFTQASTIKLQILVELLKQVNEGRLSLDDSITMTESDLTVGSGVLRHLSPDAVIMTVRDVATLMIIASDNTATNMMIDMVGMENVNRTMRELGFTETKLQRKMMDTLAWKEGRENLSTPHEVTSLLAMIYEAEILDRGSCEELLRILSIPKGGAIRTRLPEDVRIAHKTGGVGGVQVDAGIVYLENKPFVIAVMTNWIDNSENAREVMSEISLVTYNYFNRLSQSNEYGHR